MFECVSLFQFAIHVSSIPTTRLVQLIIEIVWEDFHLLNVLTSSQLEDQAQF